MQERVLKLHVFEKRRGGREKDSISEIVQNSLRQRLSFGTEGYRCNYVNRDIVHRLILKLPFIRRFNF